MKRPLILVAALAGTLALAGCDDAKDTEQDSAQQPPTTERPSAAKQPAAEESAAASDAADAGPAEVIPRTLEGELEFSATDVPLPDEAEVTISLRDVSRADAPAIIIAETRVTPGNVDPVTYSLDYDAGQVDPKRTYSLRAALHGSKGELLWTTTALQTVDVGPEADPGRITLVLEPVNAAVEEADGSFQDAQQALLTGGDDAVEASDGAHPQESVNERATEMQEPPPPVQEGGDEGDDNAEADAPAEESP